MSGFALVVGMWAVAFAVFVACWVTEPDANSDEFTARRFPGDVEPYDWNRDGL